MKYASTRSFLYTLLYRRVTNTTFDEMNKNAIINCQIIDLKNQECLFLLTDDIFNQFIYSPNSKLPEDFSAQNYIFIYPLSNNDYIHIECSQHSQKIYICTYSGKIRIQAPFNIWKSISRNSSISEDILIEYHSAMKKIENIVNSYIVLLRLND